MRILHTADWHVGRTLRGRDRSAEHVAVLAEIAGVAEQEAVDLVVVAGDLFDTASPTPEAERIVYRALLELAATGATVLVVPGNHDNARRLDAVAPVFAGAGHVIVQPYVRKPDEGGVASVQTRSNERAQVAFLPFVSQRYAISAADLMSKDAAEHALKYADRMKMIVDALSSGFAPDAVNLLIGHLTLVGGQMGGGERQAQTIFDYWVAPQVFPGTCHYAALGHLHRTQRLDGPCPLWYPGSPLQLDFGEGKDTKHVLLVDVSASKPADVREIPLAAGRRLRTVQGTLAQLGTVAGSTGDDYLRVFVQEPARVGLADDVRELLGEHVVDIVVVAPDDPGSDRPPSREGRTPSELFAMYLEERNATDEHVIALFDRLLDEETHAPTEA